MRAEEIIAKIGDKPVKIISRLDVQGIASSSIIISMLLSHNKKFTISFARYITPMLLNELCSCETTIILLGLGAGHASVLNQQSKSSLIIIFDSKIAEAGRIICINGSNLADAAYSFAKDAGSASETAVIALLASNYEDHRTVEEAVVSGFIEVKKEFNLLGAATMPLHQVLEYSINPFLPGVSGNLQGAINFISETGIPLRDKKGKFRKFSELNEDEIKLLATSIILKRLGSEKNPGHIQGMSYYIKHEPDSSPLKNIIGFRNMLEASVILNKPSIGLGMCLNRNEAREKGIELLNIYRNEVISAVNWFIKCNCQIAREKYVIINAEDHIKERFISKFASIIAESNMYNDGAVIIAMANTLDGNIYSSIRISGSRLLNMEEVLKPVRNIGCDVLPYSEEFNIILPPEKEKEFISTITKSINCISMEEIVA